MSSKFPKSFYHRHDQDSISKRLADKLQYSYLKDFVYGSIDGTVTTFAVVAGVVGAQLPHPTILILGFANLLADGFSMAASNGMGTKTENQERMLLQEFESHHIDHFPDGEKEEVRQILIKKGYEGDLLKSNIDFITSNKERWIETMMYEEYGLSNIQRSPLKAGLITFIAFAIFGGIPLIPYLFRISNPFFWATVLTGLSFLLIGSFKSRWTPESGWRSALMTLALGGIAASLAYGTGYLLRPLLHP